MSEVETENSEEVIADLRRQLRRARIGYVPRSLVQEAIQYGKTHYGMCSQIDAVANRFNLLGNDTIKVKVNLGVYGEGEVEIDFLAWEAAEDDTAKTDLLKEKIKIGVTVDGSSGFAITPEIVSFEEVEPEEVVPEGQLFGAEREDFNCVAPEGYAIRYVSRSGRVAHLVSTDNLARRWPDGPAACGQTSYDGWQISSPRARRAYNHITGRRTNYEVCTSCINVTGARRN